MTNYVTTRRYCRYDYYLLKDYGQVAVFPKDQQECTSK